MERKRTEKRHGIWVIATARENGTTKNPRLPRATRTATLRNTNGRIFQAGKTGTIRGSAGTIWPRRRTLWTNTVPTDASTVQTSTAAVRTRSRTVRTKAV